MNAHPVSRRRPWFAAPLLVCAALTGATVLAQDKPAGAAPAANPLTSRSRTRHAHYIELRDAEGRDINPNDEFAQPYSPMQTCLKCHDTYSTAHGYHFNAPASTQPAAGDRPGEPWIYADPESDPKLNTRTQIPVSSRGWAGTFKPETLGLTDYNFIKQFGHHMPGGGMGDLASLFAANKDDVAGATIPPQLRDPKNSAKWERSGALEVDCMVCHNATGNYDAAEQYEKLVRANNFSAIPTVALHLGQVGPNRPAPKPTTAPASGPAVAARPLTSVIYDKSLFTKEGDKWFVFMDITNHPPASLCYYCHSQAQVAPTAPPRWHEDADVHVRAGMACTECHRNDISHQIVRGFENEPRPAPPTVSAGALTCAGCHYGDANSKSVPNQLGRLGAPHPKHAGLPPLHFDKLTCTACHSGPWPDADARAIQTSMAHGLGQPKRESDWARVQQPFISGPVFVKEPNDNRIAPQRVMYPTYWGFLKDGKVTPLPPTDDKYNGGKLRLKSAFKKGSATTKPSSDGSLSDGQIYAVLEEIAKQAPNEGEPIYVGQGWTYKRGGSGELAAAGGGVSAGDPAAPYAWPIAHDVRPAAQALGARGCTDCHSPNAPIYFGKVISPLEPRQASFPQTTQIDLRHARGDGGESVALAGAWAWSFGYRPYFKIVAFVGAGVLGLILLRYGLAGVAALSRYFGGK